MNFLDTRPCEPLFRRSSHSWLILEVRLGRRFACAEKAITAGVVSKPLELARDARAGVGAYPRHLRTQESEIEECEGECKPGLRSQRLPAGFAEREMTNDGVEAHYPSHHGEARSGAPERSHERDEHVDRRGESPRERPLETKQRRVKAHGKKRPDLEIEKKRRVASQSQFGAESFYKQKRPNEHGTQRDDPDWSGRGTCDNQGRKNEGQDEPVRHAGHPPSEERRADENLHAVSAYQGRSRSAKRTTIDGGGRSVARGLTYQNYTTSDLA